MKRLGCILLFFTTPAILFAQTLLVKGIAIDNKTKEPLPFVNIVVTKTFNGTTSDIDGRFQISFEKGQSIEFRYVGYQAQTITPEISSSYLIVRLQEQATQLREVVIHAGENPALKIIRRVIENKPNNDPQNLDSYIYNSYNKLIGSLASVDMQKAPIKDSVAMRRFMDENHLFVSESYTRKQYVKPNLNKETVLGNRFSGLKDPFFAFLATDFQPFGFYQETIRLFDKFYISPVSSGGLKRYDYVIMDTVIHSADSVYIISFEPLDGKVFEALKGQLYINTDGYAIEHVLAHPADDKLLIQPRIQQQYKKVDGHWFPSVLNSELKFLEYVINGAKPYYASRSYLTNIQIGEKISQKEFGLLNVEFDRQANKQQEDFWKTTRSDSLTHKEQNTYQMYDTLTRQVQIMTGVMKALEGIFVGKFKVGKFYLPIKHLVRINRYESLRLGVGLQTGEQISKFFSFDGYIGYGFKDKALKYGGGLQLNLSHKKDLQFRFSYQQDVVEPGRSEFIPDPVLNGSEILRNWITGRMDSVEQFKVELNWRPLRYTQFNLFLQSQKRNPTYGYSFLKNDAEPEVRHFNITQVGLNFRYAYKESFTQLGPHKVVTFQSYPQIQLLLSAGIDGLFDSDHNFTKAEIKIDDQFTLTGMGTTTFQLASGISWGKVPYPFLFNGKGTRYSDGYQDGFVIRNYFQTMGLYEFVSSRYAYLFIYHNIGRITGTKSKHFRPELALIHNMGYGSLDDREIHSEIEFSTLEKGYYESGLMVSDLLRFKYIDLLYFGIGGGIFYRYGPYAYDQTADNFFYKIVLNISF